MPLTRGKLRVWEAQEPVLYDWCALTGMWKV